MVQLTDSNRRLIIFIAIVFGGSVLLLFDIPVLYLMLAVLGLAFILLLITGTIIISEFIRDLRLFFKSRPKKEKKPKKTAERRENVKSGGGIFASLLAKVPKPSLNLPKISLPSISLLKSSSKPEKKAKSEKRTEKEEEEEPTEDDTPLGTKVDELESDGMVLKEEEPDNDILDGIDFDDSLDIDAELDSVNPDFDIVRTPFSSSSMMDTLPTADEVKHMDISTQEEEEEVNLDDDQGDDEIDSIYSSSIDIGSDSGGDIISSMEGGGSISSADLSSYSSSDSPAYRYGDDDSGGGEEQFELSQTKTGDDDLIASLKADIEGLKKRDDDVLLRDLKDMHVSAEELVDELQQIMKATKGKQRRNNTAV